MVQISGKYKLVENRNFYEFLLGVGLPEEAAKKAKEITGTLEVTVDGNKVTMANDNPQYSTTLTVGEEVEERMATGVILKSTAALSDDVITITSRTSDDHPAGTRTFTFSDTGLEMVIAATKDDKKYEATRIYKRV